MKEKEGKTRLIREDGRFERPIYKIWMYKSAADEIGEERKGI